MKECGLMSEDESVKVMHDTRGRERIAKQSNIYKEMVRKRCGL